MVQRGEIVELSLLSRELLVADFYSPWSEVEQRAVVAQQQFARGARAPLQLDYLTAWDHKRLVRKSRPVPFIILK